MKLLYDYCQIFINLTLTILSVYGNLFNITPPQSNHSYIKGLFTVRLLLLLVLVPYVVYNPLFYGHEVMELNSTTLDTPPVNPIDDVIQYTFIQLQVFVPIFLDIYIYGVGNFIETIFFYNEVIFSILLTLPITLFNFITTTSHLLSTWLDYFIPVAIKLWGGFVKLIFLSAYSSRTAISVFGIKFILIILLLIFVRGGIPRYRYDFLTKMGWFKYFSWVLLFFTVGFILYVLFS